jgi:hypothetical protein
MRRSSSTIDAIEVLDGSRCVSPSIEEFAAYLVMFIGANAFLITSASHRQTERKRISFSNRNICTTDHWQVTMTSFWHHLLFVVHFSLAKSQNLNANLNPNSSAIHDFTTKGPRVTTLAAVAQAEHITLLENATKQFNQQIKVFSQSFLLNPNPLLTALKLCEMGNLSRAKVIIAGRVPDGNDLTLTAIAYVSDFYHIPVLTIGSRENIFSDKVKIRIRE